MKLMNEIQEIAAEELATVKGGLDLVESFQGAVTAVNDVGIQVAVRLAQEIEVPAPSTYAQTPELFTHHLVQDLIYQASNFASELTNRIPIPFFSN